jgi:hypothetical protein
VAAPLAAGAAAGGRGRLLRGAASAFVLVGPLAAGGADTHTPPLLPAKPKWLTELSVSLKESYDNNVFLSGVKPRDLPAYFLLPPGGAFAQRNRFSWVTAVSPRIGLDLAPPSGDPHARHGARQPARRLGLCRLVRRALRLHAAPQRRWRSPPPARWASTGR